MGGGLSKDLKYDLISLLEVVTDSNISGRHTDETKLIRELDRLRPELKTFKK